MLTPERPLMHDVATGRTTPIAPMPVFCVSWSPGSQRFSYVAQVGTSVGLYAAEVTGAAKLIFRAPSAPYRSGSTTSTFHGALTCGVWIAEDRLVFQRFAGSLPAQAARLRPSLEHDRGEHHDNGAPQR